MLGEAIRHVRSLPSDAARHADALEALLQQIESRFGGRWNAARGFGTDGSHVFLGRQGEALVVAPDGRFYRGSLGKGISIVALGLAPDYASLKPLD